MIAPSANSLTCLGNSRTLPVDARADLRLGIGHRVGRIHAGVGLAAGVDEKR